MGRIVTSVTVKNAADPTREIRCDALVDTGASALFLPTVWRERLGDLRVAGHVDMETADQRVIGGEACGPVEIQIEGFRPIFSEVIFLEMTPAEGRYEPLLGYIVLEQSQAAVDMVGHRLVPVKHIDLK
jgi:hypothetical protein